MSNYAELILKCHSVIPINKLLQSVRYQSVHGRMAVRTTPVRSTRSSVSPLHFMINHRPNLIKSTLELTLIHTIILFKLCQKHVVCENEITHVTARAKLQMECNYVVTFITKVVT